jgi:hypothetical protein
VQAKGICNIFNKTVTEKFPNLEKVLPIQVQETSKQKKDLAKIEPLHGIVSLKNKHREQRKNIEGYKREKNNVRR